LYRVCFGGGGIYDPDATSTDATRGDTDDSNEMRHDILMLTYHVPFKSDLCRSDAKLKVYEDKAERIMRHKDFANTTYEYNT
jgi:hypothetical protein